MRRIWFVVLVLAIGFGSTLLGSQAGAQTQPTTTVMPDANLIDGQSVSVRGSDWASSVTLTLMECSFSGILTCGSPSHVTTDDAGSFATTFVVHRFVGVDCAHKSENGGCILIVSNADKSSFTGSNLSFVASPVITTTSLVSNAEGNSGTTPFVFAVTLSDASTQTVSVEWNTLPPDQTTGCGPSIASPGTDYIAGSGTVTFAPGVTAQSVTVDVIGDTIVEPFECFDVSFHDPVNAAIGNPVVVGIIRNDDAVPVPTIVPTGGQVVKPTTGTATLPIAVSLTVPTTVTVTAQWNTLFLTGASDVQATPNTDYTPASGTVTFAPGQTGQTVPIEVKSGILADPYKIFVVSFHNATNAHMGGFWGLAFGFILGNTGQARLTKLNPATLPELAIAALTKHH